MDATDDQVTLLDADGNLLAHPVYKVDLDDDALRRLYEQLVVVRRIDNEATYLQRQGQLGIWAPCLGQEAAQVGSATALRPDDFIFPSYRELGVAWVRGVDPVDILRLYRGASLSGWDVNEHSFACYSIPIGTQPLHAVGWAVGAKWEGSDQVAAAYFGDGATSEGDVSEALNFAAVLAAPVVFVCQNNQWAISVPLSRQTAAPIWRRGPAFGMPGVQVDGNDVLAVYAVMRDAVARARDGGGPTLVEAVTYRLGAHTTSDDPTRYRTSDELDAAKARDPIARYQRFL
jgi:pyruvate dehydrogenase E1 component alpha subunit